MTIDTIDYHLGQFTSADTMQGLNRYGYVGGNPESGGDPTGHCGISNRMTPCVDGGSNLLCGMHHNPYGAVCIDDTPGSNPYWDQAVKDAQCGGKCRGALALFTSAYLIAPFYTLSYSARLAGYDQWATAFFDLALGTGEEPFIPIAQALLDKSVELDPGVAANQLPGSGPPTMLYRSQRSPKNPDGKGAPNSEDIRKGRDIHPINVNGVDMVGPSYTGFEGLSTFDNPIPADKPKDRLWWWSTDLFNLPNGLAFRWTSDQDKVINGVVYHHYNIYPARDMDYNVYLELLNQISWNPPSERV